MSPETAFSPDNQVPQELLSYRTDPVLNSMIRLFYEERLLGLSFRGALEKFVGSSKHIDKPEKYWNICSDTCNIMARIVNHDHNVAISPNPTPGHPRIELAIALYDPDPSNPDLNKKDDQTYIRYYTGKYDAEGNEILYSIDPIYQAAFGKKREKGDLIIRRHTTATIDANLAREFSLYPSRGSAYFWDGPFVEREKDKGDTTLLTDFVHAFNTDRVTEPGSFLGISGKIRDLSSGPAWTERMVWMIRAYRPDWNGIRYPDHTRVQNGGRLIYAATKR